EDVALEHAVAVVGPLADGALWLGDVVFGGEILPVLIVEAFSAAVPTVSARLMFLDRPVNLIEEGIDLALRMGELADSSMVATRVGEARRVVVAAPSYLKSQPPIAEPSDLAEHQIIALDHMGSSWTFSASGSSASRTVQFAPRLVCNSVRAVVASALAGRGVARVLPYHVAEQVRRGELEIVLAGYEPPLWPVHLISPHGRLSVSRVRAFVDFATPRLRSNCALLIQD